MSGLESPSSGEGSLPASSKPDVQQAALLNGAAKH